MKARRARTQYTVMLCYNSSNAAGRSDDRILHHAPFNHIHETGFGGSVSKVAEWDGERLFILSCQGCLSGVSRSSRGDILNEKE